MKGSSCAFIAAVLAASTAALSSSGDLDFAYNPCSNEDFSAVYLSGKKGGDSTFRKMMSSSLPSDKEKFAPRFDGLRFIETLVTAHR